MPIGIYMKFDLNHLYGIYRVQDIVTHQNGQPIEDSVIDGVFTFTRDHLLSVVNGSKSHVMSYVGKFTVENDVLLIEVKVCNYRDVEGSVLKRKIERLDQNELVVSMVSSDGTKSSVISWKKMAAL